MARSRLLWLRIVVRRFIGDTQLERFIERIEGAHAFAQNVLEYVGRNLGTDGT
jgi:hypothetical protein